MIQRGDVVLVNLDPVVGSEVGKTRPAVVLQNDLANRSSPTVTVIPVSSSIGRVFPFQVLIPAGEGGLERDSKVLCEQIRTVSRSRLHDRLGAYRPSAWPRSESLSTAMSGRKLTASPSSPTTR